MTRINLKTHKAKVYINGKKVRTIPISGGKPGLATRSGTKLIMDKRPLVRMTGVSIGIRRATEDYDLKVRYAMRITPRGVPARGAVEQRLLRQDQRAATAASG